MNKFTYTVIEVTGRHRIEKVSQSQALIMGERYFHPNGEEWVLYQSDIKSLNRYREQMLDRLNYMTIDTVSGNVTECTELFHDSQDSAWWD